MNKKPIIKPEVRKLWNINPVTRIKESERLYKRNKIKEIPKEEE